MKDEKTLNDKIEKFDKLVEWFYSDEFDLGKAESKYKKSIELAEEIRHDLDELKNKIEILAKDFTK